MTTGWITMTGLLIAGWLVVWLTVAGLVLVPNARRRGRQRR